MKRMILCSAALALIAGLAGCLLVDGSDGDQEVGDENELVGVTWLLTTINGEDPGCDEITILFQEDGRLEGGGKWNTYAGSYEVTSDASLSIYGSKEFGHLPSTRVDEPDCSKYIPYLFAVIKAQSYAIKRNRLTIRGREGVLLKFVAAK